MQEMGGGLGPAKGKDFATSLGPWVVSPDELNADGDGRYGCLLEAFVNGRRIGGGDLRSAYFSWAQVLSRASANTVLRPGDVIGSGTVGTGCLLEARALGHRKENPWLVAGDSVELRGGILGSLVNPIVSNQPKDGEQING
jgi:fumarylacetoacetate (FAA) hydrolase